MPKTIKTTKSKKPKQPKIEVIEGEKPDPVAERQHKLAWKMLTKVIDKDKNADLEDAFQSACILLKALIISNADDEQEEAQMAHYCMELLEGHLDHFLSKCADCGGPLDHDVEEEVIPN